MTRIISITTKGYSNIIGEYIYSDDKCIQLNVYNNIITIPNEDIFLIYDTDKYENGDYEQQYKEFYKDFYKI